MIVNEKTFKKQTKNNLFNPTTQPVEYSLLTHFTWGKIFSRQHFEIFFLFFPENKIWHFIQIVPNRDNLYEMSNPVSWEKYKEKISQIAVCWISQESDKGKRLTPSMLWANPGDNW